jgi:predicted type IV restriction endonuclease
MTVQANIKLLETIREIAAKIRKFQDRKLGEQSTKASLIEPVLEALGWDIRDPDEVQHEFKRTSKANPVDYALCILREPRLLVEAKGLGESLADEKWVHQVLSYATVAGVGWCILTNGDEYRFYNVTAPVGAEEKLFCTIRLSASQENEVAGTLNLISRSNMEGKIPLDELWSIHFVDRRVKAVLLRMQETKDKGLVRLIRKRSPELTAKKIVESLRRLDIRIALPSAATGGSLQPSRKLLSRSTTEKLREAGRKAARTRRELGQVSLADILNATLLTAPTRLFRNYKGQTLEATLLPDGRLEFQGDRFDSCSTAAERARATVTGRRMNTNGWAFWQFLDAKGNTCTLDRVQKAFRAGKQQR